MKWLNDLWNRIKPGVKAALMKVIRAKLQPAITEIIRKNKEDIIKRLTDIRPEDNSAYLCNWLEDYFNKQL